MEYKNILIAPDSFKESLDALFVAEAIERGIIASGCFPYPYRITKLPLSDGGEGFLQRVCEDKKGIYVNVQNVSDPLGREINAQYGIIDGNMAIVESARTCGMQLIERSERDLKMTSSYGLGLLLKDIMNKGLTKVTIGLGGSVTNDGGSG